MTILVGLRSLRLGDDAALVELFADFVTASVEPGPVAADIPRWRPENSDVAGDFRTCAITDDTDELPGLGSPAAGGPDRPE